MNTIQIKLYDIFRKDLNMPDTRAAEFVAVVEEVIEQGVKKDSHELATKGDVRNVEKEIHLLELKIEQTKGDIYKAMFVSGVIQLIAILSGVLAIVKFMK